VARAEFALSEMSAAHSSSSVVLYSTPFCGYCVAAKRLLTQKGVAFQEIDVMLDSAQRQEMMRRSRRHSVPQIFVGAQHVGGYDELRMLEARGELDELLGQHAAAPR
jgi:glutaredoxin 3